MQKDLQAIFKFNNGLGALLCSSCSIIIKEGKDYTHKEHEASMGLIEMQAQYCKECKDKNNDYFYCDCAERDCTKSHTNWDKLRDK